MPEISTTDLTGTAPATGQNWAAIIKDIKEIVSSLKGMSGAATLNQAGQQAEKLLPQAQQGTFAGFMKLVNELGLGDVPVGEIISRFAPYSLNQIKELGQGLLTGQKTIGLGDDVRLRK